MNLGFDERDRDSIARDLESDDVEVRRLAVERSGTLPQAEAILLLVDRLGDASWRVRKAAVERLVTCSDTAQTADALIGALGDGENPGRRNAAVEALVACGARVVPKLVAAVTSRDEDVRKLVVDALAGIADARATPALIDRLRDSDANVRAAAADALGAAGGGNVASALRAVATRVDEDRLVRFSALHALAVLEVPLFARDLQSVLDDPVLRPAGIDLLGRSDDEQAVAVLLKALATDSRTTREAAMRALLRVLSRVDGARAEALVVAIREVAAAASSVIEIAVERLADAPLSTRLVLIQFLGLLASERGVVPILLAGCDEALAEVALGTLEQLGGGAERAIDAHWNDLDGPARRDACNVFGRLHGERSATRLLAALDDGDPEIRIAAVRAIGQRRLAEALPLLVRRLEVAAAEGDPEAEEEVDALTEALTALASPGSTESATAEQTMQLLAERLAGASEDVRVAIARVFGRIGRHEHIELVTLLLKDPSAHVRRAAVDALSRLDPDTVAEPLRLALADESFAVRIAAADALGASARPGAIEDLRRLADDEDARVRVAALRSIGSHAERTLDPASREIARGLVEAAVGDEPFVALAALEILQRLGGVSPVHMAALLARSEPEILREAVACVAAPNDTAALEPLLLLVSHADWSVRAEAIRVLADRGVTRAVPAILRLLESEQDGFVRDAILRALERLEA
jgi:HEAT repeat protein